jgi:acyl-CoA reductase-like NAD-dependent aldehyde dehydrogenase
MFPPAIACGNTVLMKPSERDPGATMILAKLARESWFNARPKKLVFQKVF